MPRITLDLETGVFTCTTPDEEFTFVATYPPVTEASEHEEEN